MAANSNRPKKAAKRGRKPLPKDELEKRKVARRFAGSIVSSFKNAGFTYVPTRNKAITFAKQRSEIDSIFVFENVIVVAEDTCIRDSDDHLRKKAEFYSSASKAEIEFAKMLAKEFPELNEVLGKRFDFEDAVVKFMYFSLHPVNEEYRDRYQHVTCVPGTGVKYFSALSKTLRKSSRFELFKLLGVPAAKISSAPAGHGATHDYDGFVLSGNKTGLSEFKLVSFYVDPKTLLETSYVLRKDSWEDKDSLYQRMLIRSKLAGMRRYLAEERRVYINNVIVSLDSQVAFKDHAGANIPFSQLRGAQQIKVSIPRKYNSIGLIDGQHRVFSYYEGDDEFEPAISDLRSKQQLLVTGIVFPSALSELERHKFEARLFLEINDKQSRARGDLKQAIETIVSPYTSTAIAKLVISKMSRNGALAGLLDDHFFGDGKIKTASIVSYALKHLVAIRGGSQKTLYARWTDPKKQAVLEETDLEAQQRYVDYCAKCLLEFFGAYKANVSKGLWTTERKVSRALTTTAINGLIFALRRHIQDSKPRGFNWYADRLSAMPVDFTPKNFKYKSSNWKTLGDEIYESCLRP